MLLNILPQRLHNVRDQSMTPTTLALNKATESADGVPAVQPTTKSQRLWDDPCCKAASLHLTNTAIDVISRARHYASLHETSGAWLHALPITSIGLRLSNDAVIIAVCLRLGLNQCQPHTCHCGTLVDATATHGLACKKSAGRYPRHNQLNEVIWRALNRAQIPSMKEPGGLSRSNGKLPDGVTMIPWSRGRCLTWDVKSPDTLAPTNIAGFARESGSAAGVAEARKIPSDCTNSYFRASSVRNIRCMGRTSDGIRHGVRKTCDFGFGRRQRNILFATTAIHRHTARQCDCMPRVTA